MRLTVALTVSGQREAYFRRTMDSWARVRGVRDVSLLFSCEPSRHFQVAEFRDYLARNFTGCWYRIEVNEARLGCFANTRRALDLACERDPGFVVLAEEDTTVADDTLEYFRWAAEHYHDDPEVAAVCAHAFAGAGRPDQVTRVSWFSPIVWGTWPDRWREFIRPGWGGALGNPDAWDANLRSRVAAAQLACVFPVRSRSQHHGRVSTLTPGALADYFYRGSLSSCYQDHYPPQEYREHLRTPELALIV